MKQITKKEYIVGIINSIAKKYPELRTSSKSPSFAMQYNGTAFTLHKKSGFPMEQAKSIYKSYHELYKVTGEFNKDNERFMTEHGYIECAFGLRLRTPIIGRCVLGNSKTPYVAAAEVRSANNSVTQSWGMLLNRAAIATNNRIIEAGLENDILPVNLIHDAEYFIVRNDPKIIKFLNDTLIEEMEWNDYDKIRSKDVPMTAELEIGKDWSKQITLKNYISEEEIIKQIATL
ncbi:MAG: DNA polymerase [Nanoarchaeota archaeon]|nr:DNA polymerase [Nanoarchaeota archaeon]